MSGCLYWWYSQQYDNCANCHSRPPSPYTCAFSLNHSSNFSLTCVDAHALSHMWTLPNKCFATCAFSVSWNVFSPQFVLFRRHLLVPRHTNLFICSIYLHLSYIHFTISLSTAWRASTILVVCIQLVLSYTDQSQFSVGLFKCIKTLYNILPWSGDQLYTVCKY